MSDCVTFHAQLAYILDVLANKALEEICKVVDDGYAVLRFEVSRHQKENEALKRKLQLMELRVAQSSERRELLQSTDLAQGGHTFKRSTADEDRFPVEERIFSQQTDAGLRRGEEVTVTDEEDVVLQPVITKEEDGQVLLIKEERHEDQRTSELQVVEATGRERAVELRAGECQEMQNKPANHTEELSEQHRTRHGVWEVSGPEPVLKAEAETESAHQGENQQRTGRLNHLDFEFEMSDRPGQLGTYCTEESANTETEDPCCSYSTGMDPECLSIPFADGQDMNGCDLTFITPGSVQTHLTDGRKKRILCKYCGRGFARRDALEIHQRVHTGEKPFSCTQCGKQFAHSGNLKVHQSVHTGERRFSCTLCGKCFVSSSHLKRHWNVHTRERPFGCAQCGKRFSDSGSCKRHQSVHAGRRVFTCSQCGKRFTSSGHLKRHRLHMHTSNSLVDIQSATVESPWQQENNLIL